MTTPRNTNKLIESRKWKYNINTGYRITLAWQWWRNLLWHAHITKTIANKTKTTIKDSGCIRTWWGTHKSEVHHFPAGPRIRPA